jgi:hypothetical protein
MERRQETTTVKQALIKAGFDKNNLTVKHGTGTAHGWIKVRAEIRRAPSCACGEPDEYGRRETCDECRNKFFEIRRRMLDVTLGVTGRQGDYAGRKMISLSFAE